MREKKIKIKTMNQEKKLQWQLLKIKKRKDKVLRQSQRVQMIF